MIASPVGVLKAPPGRLSHTRERAHSHMTDAQTLLGKLNCTQSRATRLRPALDNQWAFTCGDFRALRAVPSPAKEYDA